jgi:hypothetical protein
VPLIGLIVWLLTSQSTLRTAAKPSKAKRCSLAYSGECVEYAAASLRVSVVLYLEMDVGLYTVPVALGESAIAEKNPLVCSSLVVLGAQFQAGFVCASWTLGRTDFQ